MSDQVNVPQPSGVPLRLLTYDPFNWYWQVGGDADHVFSSASAGLVDATDETYVNWLKFNQAPSKIASKDELHEVLTIQVPDIVASASDYFGAAARRPGAAASKQSADKSK